MNNLEARSILKALEEAMAKEREKIDKDDRYHYPSATVEINAPLALIQCAMEAKMDLLDRLQAILKPKRRSQ